MMILLVFWYMVLCYEVHKNIQISSTEKTIVRNSRKECLNLVLKL